jgi:osmoprotectant transport system substrate-binding protein
MIAKRTIVDAATRLGRLIALLALLAAVAAPAVSSAQPVVVGGKNFTEQFLIAEITRQLLEARGFAVIARTGFASQGLRREQEVGLVDLYWEYTGTSLVTYNNVREALGPEEAYRRVAALDAAKGLVWLTPSKVNNSYALAMRRSDAARRGVASISDLAALIRGGERLRFASNTEFFIRPDGLIPLQQRYRFSFEPHDVLRMETDAIYDVLRHPGSVEVGLVFSTDGRVAAYDLLLLEDDLGFFPSYLLTPVVRQAALDRHPGLAAPLNELSAKLDNAVIAELNAEIAVENRPVEDVAAAFLRASGLI